MSAEAVEIEVGDRIGAVSGLLLRPADAWLLYVLAHGAGAGMRHRFMETVAEALAARGVATLRYQFPFTQAGGRRPDPPGVLEATVRAAVATARAAAPTLPLVAGGKSLGGRMTSNAQARRPLARRGRRSCSWASRSIRPSSRASAGPTIWTGSSCRCCSSRAPGTSWRSSTSSRPVCRRLGDRATLHVVEGGDHGFDVLKRSGRTDTEVMDELAETAADWCRSRMPG